MPALDFPSSPTNGQVFGQYTYDSTKGAWRVTGSTAMSVIPSPTPPTSPVAGNLWLNTNDGVLFYYYNDGNSSQWVEAKSNTASGSTVAARVDALEAKPSGLVPLIPTSVVVGSGTASVASDGLVTFSAVTSISFNSIFTSAYTNYRIMFPGGLYASVNAAELMGRYRNAGTDSAVNYYQNGMYQQATGAVGSSTASNSTKISTLNTGNNYYNFISYDIYSPAKVTPTLCSFVGNSYTTSGGLNVHATCMHDQTVSYDGFTAFIGSGTFSGTARIYGYR